MSTGGMASTNPGKAIRVANLKKLKLSASELTKQHGRTYAYWQGLLNGSRPFGEKAARSIEGEMGLAHGWLDRPESTLQEAASPFRDLDPFEAQLVTLYRNIGAVGGREAQEAALNEMNLMLTRANAASASPVSSLGDPFAHTRGKLFVGGGEQPAAKKTPAKKVVR